VSESNHQSNGSIEPYLEGNPWIVVLALSLMPFLILLGAAVGFPWAVAFAILGLISAIPAEIFAIRSRNKIQWTFLSAIVTVFLGVVHVGFMLKLLEVIFKF
jgi:hypothetical protein